MVLPKTLNDRRCLSVGLLVGRSVGWLVGNNGGHASVVSTSLIVNPPGLSVVCLPFF